MCFSCKDRFTKQLIDYDVIFDHMRASPQLAPTSRAYL
jgi:hypothetical protein